MKNMISIPFCLLALLTLATSPTLAVTLLSADFEGKTVDQPIGEGGPTLGEPILQTSPGVVRDTPFPTNCLEFQDDRDFGTAGARFEFLDGQEITSGTLSISVDFWFAEMNGYYFYTREKTTAAKSFNTIYFRASGNMVTNDANGSLGAIGQYETGRAIPLRIEHDLDAGTYDIWWDGVRVVENRAHGVSDRGIGSLWLGFDHDADLLGTVYVDNLLVEVAVETPVDDTNWGAVKARFE